MTMERVGRELTCNQIDFDIVCTDMLVDQQYYGTKVENGELHINQEKFKALIVPYSERITKELAEFIAQNKDFPVIFVDQLPTSIVNANAGDLKDLSMIKSAKVILIHELVKELKKAGYQDIEIDTPFEQLSFYHYKKEEHIFMFQNEAISDAFCGKITLPTMKKLVIYHGFENKLERLITTVENGKLTFELYLEPAKSCIVMEYEEVSDLKTYVPIINQLKSDSVHMDISNNWKVSRVHQRNYPNFSESTKMEILTPISDIQPGFAGVIRYEKDIEINRKTEKIYLFMEHVFESVTIWINGKEAGSLIAPPYRIEIGDCVKTGNNHIVIEVATTLDRDQLNYPEHPFVFSHEVMEPTGMYGDIKIIFV